MNEIINEITATKFEDNKTYYSVLLKTSIGGVWMDVGLDLQTVEWNQYIFFDLNSRDQEVKEFQENCDNFDICSSVAINECERQQNA